MRCNCSLSAASREELARSVLVSPGVPSLSSADVSVRLADCGVTLRGDAARAAFSAWARAWEKDAEAHESKFSIVRVSALSFDSVSVNYSARWLTPGVLPFVRLARAWPGGLRLSFVDLRPLAGRRSTFTWGALARKLAGALASGTLELPQATVGGRLVLTFDANGLVQSVEESLDLAPDLRAGRVLNRRGASRAQPAAAHSLQLANQWQETFQTSLPSGGVRPPHPRLRGTTHCGMRWS